MGHFCGNCRLFQGIAVGKGISPDISQRTHLRGQKYLQADTVTESTIFDHLQGTSRNNCICNRSKRSTACETFLTIDIYRCTDLNLRLPGQ